APVAAQAEVAQQREPAPPAEEIDEEPVAMLHVLVAGTGLPDVPFEARLAAEGLGAALARSGHILITGGWYGVDGGAAQAFSEALPPDADREKRLLQITEGGQRPAFSGGAWIQASGSTNRREVLNLAQVVVGIGGLGGTMDILRLADQMHKHVVPLRWT